MFENDFLIIAHCTINFRSFGLNNDISIYKRTIQ